MLNRRFLSLIFIFYLAVFTNSSAQETAPEKYWVFFKNKQVHGLTKSTELLEIAKSKISPRALRRRAKVRKDDNLIDKRDLPVSSVYLSSLEELGYKPLVVTNWLNGASFLLTPPDIEKLKKLPFIKRIQPVGRAGRKPTPQDLKARSIKLKKPPNHNFDYGFSFIQNQLINVPKVHDLGITGKGVWIGMLDTGFKRSNHEVFENLNVIAEFDFVNNDGVTENEENQDVPGQHNHGTQTLSTVGGFKEGKLIGSAFGASFLLAKTEILQNEIPAEEDNWVAGIEWLENRGVDIVSSSLGYLNFPNQSFYSPADMDGNTAVTTKAADIAVSRGVVVVNSAGNEGNGPWRIIIAPADGDSVIAVGAVNSDSTLSGFSSVGPSADGRTKPDVVAMGSLVRVALPSTDKLSSQYNFSSGTSFSCPLTAGVAALVLSAHPNLTPLEVRDALRITADRAANPDNSFGWGLVNAYDAVLFHGMAFSNSPDVSVDSNRDVKVKIKVASRFGVDPNQVSLVYAKSDGNFNKEISMVRGNEINEYSATITGVAGEEKVNFYFTTVDSSGAEAVYPLNAPDSSFSFVDPNVFVDTDLSEIPESFGLAQNYPNPFNPSTNIVYILPVQSRVTVSITNLLGQIVRTLIAGKIIPAGRHSVTWDGTDDSGNFSASGVYFYQFQTDNFRDIKKMLLIR
ncbi:MAG: T9SS type A sorting domain-containing protein [Caldithrix sp.]|nr:MAG: T9SS type A sorting domain-containing protein [Caldithrix sp.]